MNKKNCPKCDKEFTCGASNGQCWCFDFETLVRTNDSGNSCYCSTCLEKLLEKQIEKAD